MAKVHEHHPPTFRCKICVFHKDRRIEANEVLFSSHSCLNKSLAEGSHGLRVEYNYLAGRATVCMPCFTTNKSVSGIKLRQTASSSTSFSVVPPDSERSISVIFSVGFRSSERFPFRNFARIRDAFFTRKLALPRVQPLETWIPSSRHDSGGDRFVQTVADRSWSPRDWSVLLAKRPIRSPRTRYGPK